MGAHLSGSICGLRRFPRQSLQRVFPWRRPGPSNPKRLRVMRRRACDRRPPGARCAAVTVPSARAAVRALPGTRPRACGTLFRNRRATVLAAPGARVSSGCSPAGRLYLTPEVRNGRPGRRDRSGHGQSRFAAGPRAALRFRGRARRDRRTRRGIAGALRRLAERSSGAACAAREGRPYRARAATFRAAGRRRAGSTLRPAGWTGSRRAPWLRCASARAAPSGSPAGRDRHGACRFPRAPSPCS